ncbi:uncharacterized protein LOC117802446 [Ailuropoda melanoleuca]|uniref:uncharacterized protein LOC117802446 n=1 Tax=Ailuropoda melanoleuca TaxID=9646 RepID=UPI0014940BD4|nr:uncharacterized protein LOC117802446 [Ailuropoda melanoleuca]
MSRHCRAEGHGTEHFNVAAGKGWRKSNRLADRSLALGEANCHVMRTLQLSYEEARVGRSGVLLLMAPRRSHLGSNPLASSTLLVTKATARSQKPLPNSQLTETVRGFRSSSLLRSPTEQDTPAPRSADWPCLTCLETLPPPAPSPPLPWVTLEASSALWPEWRGSPKAAVSLHPPQPIKGPGRSRRFHSVMYSIEAGVALGLLPNPDSAAFWGRLPDHPS